MRKNVNVMRVGIKLATAIIALYVSGFLVNVMGSILNQTASPFYTGLKLIGWTVASTNNGTTLACGPMNADVGMTVNNCITQVTGTGILSIIGLLAIACIVFEFVDFAS